MSFRLTLFKKILLLVLVPLSIELAFIGQLYRLNADVERERRAEAHAVDLSYAVNKFLGTSMGALVSSVLYYFTKMYKSGENDIIWKRNEDISAILNSQMEDIQKIVDKHPDEEEVVGRLRLLAKSM